MTREEAVKYLIKPVATSTEIGEEKQKEFEAYNIAIEALSAVCDDCIWHVCNYNKVDWDGEDGYISRQDAIDIVDQFSREEMFHYMESLELDVRATQICHSAIEAVGTIKEQIKLLPSAEPKTGEWVSNHDGSWNCSECGLRVFVYAKGNYCPNCGAKMCKGGDDE